jgi:uncharacterized delta-60 repeat protein
MLSAGDLDPSFGTDGIVVAETGAERLELSDSLILPGGKILVAGGISFGVDPDPTDDMGAPDLYSLRRFNSDGSVDKTFGESGSVSGSFTGADVDIYRIALTPGGKIMALTFPSDTTPKLQQVLARFNADGSLDTSFSGDGFVDTPETFAASLDVQSDSSVLVSFGNSIARYTAQGTLDTNFGDAGIVRDVLPGGGSIRVVRVAASGQILVGGSVLDSAQLPEFALARLNSDGSVDAAFADNGTFIIQLPSDHSNLDEQDISSIIPLPDGKFIATGNAGYRHAAFRFLPSGDLDPTFGDNGQQIALANGSTARDSFLDEAGRIYLTSFGGYIARLTPDGDVDQSFGLIYGGGGSGVYLNPAAGVFNGRVIIAGQTDDSDIVLAARLAEDNGVPSSARLSGRTLFLTGTAGDDSILAEGGLALDPPRIFINVNVEYRIFAVADIDVVEVYGGDGDDYIQMGLKHVPSHVRGGLGRDRISGSDKNDTLEGNGGRDFIDGGLGADLIIGNAGNDQLRGQGGADHLYGRAGNDHLQGNGGNDLLDGGDGIDVLSGNTGDDHLAAADGVIDQIAGGPGNDSATLDDDANAKDLWTGIETLLG